MNTPGETLPSYEIRIADNFRYADKEAERSGGLYLRAEEAIARCKAIVDRCLQEWALEGSTAAKICHDGDDPWLLPLNGAPDVPFSAWDYAKEKAKDFAR